MTRTGGSASARRERRLAEHRERVRLVRARMGDPNAALARFLAESFDPEALRAVARDFAEDELEDYPAPPQGDPAVDE